MLRRPLALALMAALACAATATASSAQTITRSQAAGVAAAIGLHHGDLPTLVASPNPITAQERVQEAQLSACDGSVPASGAWAQAQSPSFDQPSSAQAVTSISSSTRILPTTQLVARDLATAEGPRELPCVRKELTTVLEASLGKGNSVSLSGQRAAPVIAGTFTLRFTATLDLKQGATRVKVPLYADVIGFAYGQAEVSLNVVQSGARPSAAFERRLAGVLLARAKGALG